MPRPKGIPPDDRRCTATNREKARCQQYALKGKTKCRYHGGKSPGGQVTSGLRSERIKHLIRAEGVLDDDIERLLHDPDLLDAKKTIAQAVATLRRYGAWDLSDEALRKRLKDRRLVEPTLQQIEKERQLLISANLNALVKIASMQNTTRKALTQEQLVEQLILPVLANLGREFMTVVERHAPAEVLDAIRSDIEQKQRRAVIDVVQVVEAGK